jgi:hypothetical protein
MESKPSVEIDSAIGLARCRHRNARAKVVVCLLEIRSHDVQAIGRAALENRNKDLLAIWGLRRGSHQPRRCEAETGDGDCRRAKKDASIQHDYLL